ncbi:protein translocase subunit [Aspergillus nanangensis]|uniref:Mitochondrial import inner membrane translocase subunit n=1 Tax=Aspergillus nanangensis TaxID=2582783 RepID=A0AAD4CXS6_ASPNN|nr:protein translocase subunit [Aspergillus nanangensis]
MALFGSGSNGQASSPQEVKTAIVRQLQQEAAMANARNLIGKVNEHCFDACVPVPGSSMSSREESCLSQCMEKYISFWNVASRTYIARIAKESKKAGGQDTVAMNSLATAPSGAGDSL